MSQHNAVMLGKRRVCSTCMVVWPCLAKHKEVLVLDQWCKRCNREGPTVPGRRVCADCDAAEKVLNKHWQAKRREAA
jgi:hypothetical protein